MNQIEIALVIVTYQSAELAIQCFVPVHAERESQQNLNIVVVLVDNASGDLPEIGQAVERNGWSSWVTLGRTQERRVRLWQ